MGHYESEIGPFFGELSAEQRHAKKRKLEAARLIWRLCQDASKTRSDGSLTPTSWLAYALIIQTHSLWQQLDASCPTPSGPYVRDISSVAVPIAEYVDRRLYAAAEGRISYRAKCTDNSDTEHRTIRSTESRDYPLKRLTSAVPLLQLDATWYSGEESFTTSWQEAYPQMSECECPESTPICLKNMYITHMSQFASCRPEHVVASLVGSPSGEFLITLLGDGRGYHVIQIS